MKNIENENTIDPKTGSGYVSAAKGTNSDVAIVLVLVLVMGVLMVVGYIMLRNEIKGLNDDIVHMKEVLTEYGVYIDGQPQQSTSYDTSVFNVISPSDIAKESKGKTIVLWIGRQSCGYCTMYAPYITEAADNYGIKAYYIDLATLVNFDVAQPYIVDEEQFGILSSLPGKGTWDGFAEENVGGTPLTLVIKDGQVIGGLSGYADTNTVMQVFSNAGLKKN